MSTFSSRSPPPPPPARLLRTVTANMYTRSSGRSRSAAALSWPCSRTQRIRKTPSYSSRRAGSDRHDHALFTSWNDDFASSEGLRSGWYLRLCAGRLLHLVGLRGKFDAERRVEPTARRRVSAIAARREEGRGGDGGERRERNTAELGRL